MMAWDLYSVGRTETRIYCLEDWEAWEAVFLADASFVKSQGDSIDVRIDRN